VAYSTNPNLPKARQIAVQLVVRDRMPVAVAARRCGISRSTLYRWLQRWQEINEHRDGDWCKGLRGLNYYAFTIPTKSSRPHHSPHKLPDEIVETVMATRRNLGRCAEIIHYQLVQDGVPVSLSSVRRILARHHEYDRPKYKKRVYRHSLRRPPANLPGDLVETDTVHLVDPSTGTRKYILTVIDVCSRMAYAKVYERLHQLPAIETVIAAEQYCGFKFKLVQSDNGLEFGRVFKEQLMLHGIAVRHTRVRHPNDNAHIERFNRTLRQECVGQYMSSRKTVIQIQAQLDAFLEFYNYHRVHLGLGCQIPAEFARKVSQRL